MTRHIQNTLLVIMGLCLVVVSFGIGFFLLAYLADGAGLQAIGFFGLSSVTAFIGLIHVCGFAVAALLCFVVGVSLSAHGLVPAPEQKKETATLPNHRFAFFRQWFTKRRREEDGATLKCVRCATAIHPDVHLCPECGWTQPCDRRASAPLD
ncbi:MAG: hypothetical protein JWM68_634 [Verrucomicrobiales bacterium]|nr:hypothetical protein [Verrucomicrobiales bacterium]